jgi:hypothetical protein
MSYTDCEHAISIRVQYYVEKLTRWLVERESLFDFNLYLINRYSTFVVKYSWCFLTLGLIICISLGLSAVLLRDLPDFNDPTKVKF